MGYMEAHINPDASFADASAALVGSSAELCGCEGQHVLPAFEKSLSRHIVLFGVLVVFFHTHEQREHVPHQPGQSKTTREHPAGRLWPPLSGV